jgi:two-component system NtrC family sensor kinase
MNNKKMYYSRLRRGLISAFFIFILVPTLFVSWVTIYNLRKCAIQRIENSGVRMAEDRTDAVSQYLNKQIILLSTLAGMYPIKIMGDQPHLDQLFRSVNERGDVVDLHVIDSAGKQLAYVGPYRSSIEGKNYKDAPWFKEAMVAGKHVSDVFMGYRNVPHLVVAVTDPLKTYVFRATINSEKFNALLLRAQTGPSGDAYIVNRHGEFQTPSLQGTIELAAAEKNLLEYHEGTSTRTIGPFLYTSSWMKDGQWLLVVKSKISDSLGTFNERRNNSLMIITASSMLFLGAAVLLCRYMVGRLEQDDRRRADMDQQMVQVEKMASIGRLAAGIAHEINNPLQMITNQAGWIEELLPDEDPEAVKNLGEYQDAVTKIKYHVRRAGTITHRLLGFSRRMSAEKESVSVNELLEETVSFVENEAVNHNIIIEQLLDKNLPTTMTDGPQLQQVFLNLLNNCLDAVEQNGRITITTKADDTSISIEFADSGPGISAEVMKQIFDPFFTTKDPGKGTGLGMSICYDIMKKLGGKIEVKNNKVGGAIFTLTLPLKHLSESGQGDRRTSGYDESIY